MGWDSERVAFVDIETQSTCDITKVGGRGYAYHPSTRLMILCICVDEVFHVWIPDYVRSTFAKHCNLWPNKLNPAKEVRVYRGSTFPDAISDAVTEGTSLLPLVAHNAYGFDRFIWERFLPSRHEWLDTLYLARIAGRHGKLDALGKSLLGTGKDEAKKLLKKLTTAVATPRGTSYPIIAPGDLSAFTTYTIADVELLRRLWIEFDSLTVEQDVIEAHNRCNERGVEVDLELLDFIEDVANYSVAEAAKEIARLTRGRLNDNNIRSIPQVHQWIDSWGIKILDDNGKPCLRKDVVQRYINSPYIIEDHMTSATEIPPIVIDVLRLRMKALRITDAKVTRAKQRAIKGRIYDLHSYHQAHTGRASSQGVQIHNLPRPPKGLNIKRVLDAIKGGNYNRNDHKQCFDFIKAEIAKQAEEAAKPDDKLALSNLTVDDACSALIRPALIAKEGYSLCLCDFSTVEARGVAWIAEEEKLLQVFHRQDTGLSKFGPYEDFASRLYGIDISQVDAHQRQVAKPVVLGAGYGMGYDKMRIYAAAMGVDLVAAGITAEQAINLFRDTYTKIAGWKPKQKGGIESNFRVGGIWKTLEHAVKEAVSKRLPQTAGKCTFLMMDTDLVCVLPSGRQIRYPDARIEDVVPAYCYTMGLPLNPKATVTYESTRGRKSLYGGLITENVVQAICRDLLMCAMVELDRWNPVLHIHDELVCEVPNALANECLQDMVRVMSTAPHWAYGFPLNCEGFVSPRFVKKAFKGSYELTGTR